MRTPFVLARQRWWARITAASTMEIFAEARDPLGAWRITMDERSFCWNAITIFFVEFHDVFSI